MPPIRMKHIQHTIKCSYCGEKKTIILNKSKKIPEVCDGCYDAWYATRQLRKYKKVVRK